MEVVGNAYALDSPDRVSLFPHGQGLVEGRKACGRGSGGQHVKYHSVERAVDGVQDDVWATGSQVAVTV